MPNTNLDKAQENAGVSLSLANVAPARACSRATLLLSAAKPLQTPSSGNVARYDFELLREIRDGDRIHCAQLNADDSLQCSRKPDQ
jgi:hypothetical protein